MIIEKDKKTFRVGDLVRVSHPNGAGAKGWYCQPGTLGIVTRTPEDHGRGFLEMEISAASVGVRRFHVEGWSVIEQDNLFAGV
jgi:hypothetical protein